MKSLFSTSWNAAQANFWLLIIRIAVCGFMLTHGVPKFTKLVGAADIKFADPFGVGQTFSFILVVFAEFVCSIFIAMGFATRLASLVLFITMAVAAFHAHANDPFATKEKALLYLLIYLALMVFGAGRFSVDNMIAGGGKRRR
ncbi:DoxX family protein [Aridibaculum aurantiacum]|uniref:DoxX family protein n=1 Tax=Aridibaculum aurantiacum TaxID=2810307 RepID=UPI001A96007C|nr:DoxX family protein [Aridibaculum aurantiacum]